MSIVERGRLHWKNSQHSSRHGVAAVEVLALHTQFERDKRVVEMVCDGERVAVPLVVVLYMLSHPPCGVREPPLPTTCARRLMRLRDSLPEEELVWPVPG